MYGYGYFVAFGHLFINTTVNLDFKKTVVNALVLGKVACSRTTMEKWIGNEEGSLIPRGRETPYRIQGHKLQVKVEPTTMNMGV